MNKYNNKKRKIRKSFYSISIPWYIQMHYLPKFTVQWNLSNTEGTGIKPIGYGFLLVERARALPTTYMLWVERDALTTSVCKQVYGAKHINTNINTRFDFKNLQIYLYYVWKCIALFIAYKTTLTYLSSVLNERLRHFLRLNGYF